MIQSICIWLSVILGVTACFMPRRWNKWITVASSFELIGFATIVITIILSMCPFYSRTHQQDWEMDVLKYGLGTTQAEIHPLMKLGIIQVEGMRLVKWIAEKDQREQLMKDAEAEEVLIDLKIQNAGIETSTTTEKSTDIKISTTTEESNGTPSESKP